MAAQDLQRFKDVRSKFEVAVSPAVEEAYMSVMLKCAVTSIEGTLVALWVDTELTSAAKQRKFEKEMQKVVSYSETFSVEVRRKCQAKLMAESVSKWLSAAK